MENMQHIVKRIRELETVSPLSKHEQLVRGIINAIDEKVIVKGDLLPSVNVLIKELGFARETIVKAYKELIHRGIIVSKNRLGYFVATENTQQELKVALLLFAFDIFQETFYKNFRNRLGPNVHLDVFFHHNNFETFKNTVEDINGKYGMYVVAPIPHPETSKVLDLLPVNRCLIVDRFIPSRKEYNYIVQEFEESSYNAFVKLKDKIGKFSEMVFFFKPDSAEPEEILRSFRKFVKDHGIKGVIRQAYEPGSLQKGKVYFTINNLELWEMLKDTKDKGFRLGKDIGFISHNDDIIKEIIFDGVTTFSTDFALMGRKAADFVMKKEQIREVMPTVLIERNSL